MEARAALDVVLRSDRGRCLAMLAARTGDLARAEDAVQEAASSALVHWARAGVPANPAAWLYRVALRKAIDGFRRDARARDHADRWQALAVDEAAEPDPDIIPDDRLRLIFACCHPALEPKTRVALTLRTVCGLSTRRIAEVFLDAEPAMGQRLSRARAKIGAAGIPFAVPGAEDWRGRLNSVLTVVYLIFTAGYGDGAGPGRAFRAEALFLARLVDRLAPEDPEAEGCLALILLTEARAAARVDTSGATVPPARQDRALWDPSLLEEGRMLLHRALARARPGPFQIKAAIAACHAETSPDWPQAAALLAALLAFEDTPVVRLNHAVAVAEVRGASAGLELLDPLGAALADYQPFHAARASLLARTGRRAEADAAYGRALDLCRDPADRAFLAAARNALTQDKKKAETKLGRSPTGR